MNTVLDGLIKKAASKMTFSKDSDCLCLIFHKQ